MSDDADRSDDRIQHTIDDGINECRRAKTLVASGQCYYCADPVPHGYLFCCGDCRTDWEYEQARKKAMGRR
jgi:hypothetical protein